jgi:hypothetical protein
MLDAHDIQHIKENRAQITAHRKEQVILFKRVAGAEDPFTGDVTYTETQAIEEATWTALISQSGGEGEIQFDNGVHVVTDDAIINLDIEVDIGGLHKVERVRTGEQYVIKAKDIKGIGQPNRHFILLELIK